MARTVGLILPVEPEKHGKKADKTSDAVKERGKTGKSGEPATPETPSSKDGKSDD